MEIFGNLQHHIGQQQQQAVGLSHIPDMAHVVDEHENGKWNSGDEAAIQVQLKTAGFTQEKVHSSAYNK
jgi:hypothetical protein